MANLARTSQSFYESKSPSRKINFQTKLKIRGTNEFLPKSHLQNDDSHREHTDNPELTKINKSFSCFAKPKQQLNQSFNLLTSLNFSHHNSEQCLCTDCSCGRHLCKLHVVKPDLRKSTTYQNSFKRSKSILNSRVVIKQENKSLPKVEMNSTYAFSFRNKDPNYVVKEHPEDELKFEGPAQKLTMYRVNYPGNRGKNPYVRPKQVFVAGDFPLKNKRSAYNESFNKFDGFKMTESGKINDQLKTGRESLFRESFYQEKFRSPNPEDYNARVKNTERREINPDYSHQYETNYEHEFVPTEPTVCKAKVKLETRYRDMMSNSKASYNENTDFKALSSTFQALSRAPYGQYQ